MREANRRLSLVDVLTARPTGAEGVNANLVPIQHHVLIILNLWDHLKHGEGGLSSLLSIKWRDAHHAVHATFCAQPAEHIATTNLKGNATVSGTFTFGEVDNLVRKPVTLRPAHVRAKEHGGPVARFGSACAGLDRHNGIGIRVFASEEERGARLLKVLFYLGCFL